MGEVSSICDSMCGDSDETQTQQQIEIEGESVQQVEIKMKVDFVKDIDFKMSKGVFKVEDYVHNNGRMLYIFFIRSMQIKNMDIPISNQDTVDITKPNPFAFAHEKWESSDWTLDGKKEILEVIWDLIFNNNDYEDEERNVLSEQTKEQLKSEWSNLNNLEKKVYLFKFCLLAGADVNYMAGLKDMDMIERYYNLDESVDDIEFKRKLCVIL